VGRRRLAGVAYVISELFTSRRRGAGAPLNPL